MSKIEHENTRNVVCPFCGHEHMDSWELGDSDDEFVCHNCEEIFVFERDVTVTYTSYKPKENEVQVE